MSELFASGRIVDVILALMVLEGLLLAALRRRAGVGPAPLDLLANLGAGALLLVALREALTGGHWSHVAAWLAAALVAHVFDLARRWVGPGASGNPTVRDSSRKMSA